MRGKWLSGSSVDVAANFRKADSRRKLRVGKKSISTTKLPSNRYCLDVDRTKIENGDRSGQCMETKAKQNTHPSIDFSPRQRYRWAGFVTTIAMEFDRNAIKDHMRSTSLRAPSTTEGAILGDTENGERAKDARIPPGSVS